MKKLYALSIFGFLTTLAFNAKAQSDDGISALFKGNPSDVNKLIEAYANPMFKGFGNSLNGGWTNTAKTQKFLHVNLRISASATVIPNSQKTFDINSLHLENIKPSGSSIAPTFGGPKTETGIIYTDPITHRSYSTTLPKGVTQYVPAPQIQLTVGLIKYTDVTLRYIPTVKITDDVGKVGMFGFGIKHDIIQDFIKKGPEKPFDLAVAFGYTRLSYEKALDVQPENNNVNGSTDFSNQSLVGHFSGINAQAILSKKLLFFTPFISVGYMKSSTDVKLKGNFPFVTGVVANPIPGGDDTPTYTTYNNPLSIGGSGSGVSGIRGDVGFQLNLTVINIYASVGQGSGYTSGNVGIGFGL